MREDSGRDLPSLEGFSIYFHSSKVLSSYINPLLSQCNFETDFSIFIEEILLKIIIILLTSIHIVQFTLALSCFSIVSCLFNHSQLIFLPQFPCLHIKLELVKMNSQQPAHRADALNRSQNKKIIKKLNQTINLISDKTFDLQEKDVNMSRYSKNMLCSARTSPSKQPFCSIQNSSANFNRTSRLNSRQKYANKNKEFSKQKKQSQNQQFYSRSIGVQFFKSQPQNDNQLFLTMQGDFKMHQGGTSSQFFHKRNNQMAKKLRMDRKWTFNEFISSLYLQKTKDLKTEPNLKQQKIFVSRLKTKFVFFTNEEIDAFIELDHENTQFVKQLDISSSDFGFNSIKCLCQYLLSKRIHRISMNSDHSFCNIRSIILDKNPIGDEGIIVLAQALVFFKLLQKISLVSVNMSPKGSKNLLKSLMGHQNLKYVDFSSAQGLNRNRFGDSISQMELIFSHPSFSWEQINFTNINLGENGLSIISNGISKSNPTKQIYLGQNDIKSTQIAFFLSKVKFTNLIKLDLSNNQIGDEGFRLVSETIGLNYGYNTLSTSLTNLNVSNNQIKGFGIEKFCKNMLNNQSLTELSISSNPLSKGDGFINFKYFISKNWTLKKVDMSNCLSNTEDLRHLFEGLQINRALQVLKINKNNITLQTFAFLAKSLSVNKGLKSLEVGQCNISDKYIFKFEKEIKQIKYLEEIDLNNNYLSDKSSKILIEMISQNKSMVKATFLKNCLGVKALSQISSLLKSNKTRKQQSKIDQKQMEYLNYVTQIQNSNEETIKNAIQKLQKKQEKVKYTSLVCQVVKAEIQEELKKKQLQQEFLKIKLLQEKLRKTEPNKQ